MGKVKPAQQKKRKTKKVFSKIDHGWENLFWIIINDCLFNAKFQGIFTLVLPINIQSKGVIQFDIDVLIFGNPFAGAIPVGNYTFKVNNRNIRASCEICSKLTIKTPERRQWGRSGVFTVNFEHISHLVLVFLLLPLNM